jgi:ribosomal protein L4
MDCAMQSTVSLCLNQGDLLEVLGNPLSKQSLQTKNVKKFFKIVTFLKNQKTLNGQNTG